MRQLDLIQRQYAHLATRRGRLTRSECEKLYPDLIDYVRRRVSILDLVQGEGLRIEPLSPDVPNCFKVKGGCPSCGGTLLVRKNGE